MKRGPYNRRCAAGIATIAVDIPATIGAPSAYFAINGECFAFLPVNAPHIRPVRVYKTRAAA